jgi:hypothetical protein
MPNELDNDVVNLAKAIRQKESGGRFDARGASGEAGAYQFTKPTWQKSAQKYIGNANAPLTPENQNKVAYSQIKEWKDQGYNPGQIASMWNSGKPDPTGNVGVNKFGVKYDTPAYVQGVYSEYQKLKGMQPQQPQQQMPQPQGAMAKATAPQVAPQQTALTQRQDMVRRGADAFLGGGTIGDAIGTQVAKGNLGTFLQKKMVGRDLSPEEEAQVASGPTARQIGGDVLRVASNFFPFGRVAGLATSRLKAEGMKRGAGALGNVASGVAGGYAMDVGENFKQGKEGVEAFKPGLNTAFGGGIAAAGSVAGAGLRGLAGRTGHQRLDDLARNYVKPARIISEQGKRGRAPLDVLKEEKLLPEVVDSKTDTSKMIEALNQRIEDASKQTRSTLEGSGLVVPFRQFEQDIVKAIENDDTIRNLGQTNQALKQLRSILQSYRGSYGNSVPVTVIDDIRQTMNRNKWRPEQHDIYRAIGDAARKVVYDAVPDQQVKTLLQREGELLGARELAESLNARAVKSGLIGKHFESTIGGVAGALAGAPFGGVGAIPGAIVGALATRKAGDIARNAYFKTPVANLARKILDKTKGKPVSPGDYMLQTPMGARLEASMRESMKNPSLGLSVKDVSGDVLRAGQPPVGADAIKRGDEWVQTNDVVARERFNIPALKKISFGGSDRDVYDLGDGKVVKISKSARGLTQNDYSSDYYAEQNGLIPKTIEVGKNYVVKENVGKPDANTKAMVKELSQLSNLRSGPQYGGDRYWKEKEMARDIMNKYGYDGDTFADYGDVLWGDIQAPRNWGTKDGAPILLDEGSLNGDFVKNHPRTSRGYPVNLEDPRMRDVHSDSQRLKKQFGDRDSKTMYSAGGATAGAEDTDGDGQPDDIDPMKAALGMGVGLLGGAGIAKLMKSRKAVPRPPRTLAGYRGGKSKSMSRGEDELKKHADKLARDLHYARFEKNKTKERAILQGLKRNDAEMMRERNKARTGNRGQAFAGGVTGIEDEDGDGKPDNVDPLKMGAGMIAGSILGKGLKVAKGGKGLVGKKAQEVAEQNEMRQILRGTKGMTADDIMKTHPNIQLKKDVLATDVHGKKVTIPNGEKLTPYELKGNKVLLQDGEAYLVTRNQFQNVQGNSISAEGKPFAPELDGVEETVKGAKRTTLKEVQAAKDRQDWDEFERLNNEYKNPEPSSTKYSQYTLPGGEDYHEILLKAPLARKQIAEKSKFKVRERIATADDESPSVNEGDTIYDVWRESDDYAIYTTESKADAESYLKKQQNSGPYSTVDESGVYKSSHWPDDLNTLSHLRGKVYDVGGQKHYFMEESQSDWATDGRKLGFAADVSKELAEAESIAKKYGHSLKDFASAQNSKADEIDRLSDAIFEKATPSEQKRLTELSDVVYKTANDKGVTSKIPNHPLLKNWQEMNTKRALIEAVNRKAGHFTWINGEQTSARYNLATHVDEVKWGGKGQMDLAEGTVKTIKLEPKETANRFEFGIDKDGVIRSIEDGTPGEFKGKKLDEVLGKGLADKIMEKENGSLSGEGLSFGGEWAKNLYDRQVRDIVKKLTGAEVKTVDMGLTDGGKKTTFRTVGDWGNSGAVVTEKDIKIGTPIRADKGDLAGDVQYVVKPSEKKNVYWVVSDKDVVQQIKNDQKLLKKYWEPLYGTEGEFVNVNSGEHHSMVEKAIKNGDVSDGAARPVDIGGNSQQLQQSIELTPEVIARIKGEGMKIETSGRMFEDGPKTLNAEKKKPLLVSPSKDK